MIIHGDSVERLRELEAESVDALVTDPPYGLGDTSPKQVAECLRAWSSGSSWEPRGGGFMGKSWDAWVPPPELWREVYRVMKAGAHGLVFASSRTQDLMSISLRLAGFEVRDTLQWIYGSGFPKSHDVSKGVDRLLGAEREVIGSRMVQTTTHAVSINGERPDPVALDVTAPASDEPRRWEGWGTALKPAYEPAILIRKPLAGTVARNVLAHGTGALNIGATRIGSEPRVNRPKHSAGVVTSFGSSGGRSEPRACVGRWPANVLFDEASAGMLDTQAGSDVSRFFYCPKASKGEREAGLERRDRQLAGVENNAVYRVAGNERATTRANIHPTVKPLDLMRYLCRLITPPKGVVLDPFAGSGSTLCAGALEGFRVLGIEREAEYVEIARARLAHWSPFIESPAPDLAPEPAPAPRSGDQLSLF